VVISKCPSRVAIYYLIMKQWNWCLWKPCRERESVKRYRWNVNGKLTAAVCRWEQNAPIESVLTRCFVQHT
jgi:hypothetical protein